VPRDSSFRLLRVNGSAYLLPYGQAIASRLHGARLDEQGAWLWERLEHCPDGADAVACLTEETMRHYRLDGSARPQVEEDMRAFVERLRTVGALKPANAECSSFSCPAPKGSATLSAGPLTVLMVGRTDLLSKDFDAFIDRDGTARAGLAEGATTAQGSKSQCHKDGETGYDQILTLTEALPPSAAGKRILLQTPELLICADEREYQILFPFAPALRGAVVSRDGKRASYHVVDPSYLSSLSLEAIKALSRGAADAPDVEFSTPAERFSFDLFHAIRQAFLVLAQARSLLIMHSCSFLYRGRAWLVSAHSGGGKTTHARLWEQEYQTPILNGDLNMIGLADPAGTDRNASARAYGIPWCGTSGIATPFDLRLGGIILIESAETNSVELLDPAGPDTPILLLNRLISPMWEPDQLDFCAAFATKLAASIPVWRLRCTKDPEAAHVMHDAVDAWLDAQAEPRDREQ
jgi:hypothetical protein